MNIAVVGAGFVGLTHAAVCAEAGHRVIAHDIDAGRVAAYASGKRAAIEQYVNEPGLAECVAAHLGKRLFFTAEPAAAAEGAQIIFLCLPTPPRADGGTDRSHYITGARAIADVLARRTTGERVLMVNKSTVPIGTARLLEKMVSERGARQVGVASNPEFLPQGSALHCSRHPDRVVLGTRHAEDLALLYAVYRDFPRHQDTQYIETTPETAEAIKYVANALLMTYVSFWNGVAARLAETFAGIDIDTLQRGVTGDARISEWGSRVGNGAGGSCFGKDILSLMHQLESKACSTHLLRAVHEVNEFQKVYLVDRAVREAGFSFEGKTVALLGLAFKRGTNDVRDSASLRVIEALLARGAAAIRAQDPLVSDRAARAYLDPRRDPRLARVSFHASVQEAMEGSHALFISTDWDEYRAAARPLMELTTPPYLVMDGRRMIQSPGELAAAGYQYLPVGGPLLRRPGERAALYPTARGRAA